MKLVGTTMASVLLTPNLGRIAPRLSKNINFTQDPCSRGESVNSLKSGQMLGEITITSSQRDLISLGTRLIFRMSLILVIKMVGWPSGLRC